MTDIKLDGRERLRKRAGTLAGKMQRLGQVDIALPLYLCPPRLGEWVKRNKRYFIEAIDDRLTPRGILFNGAPGVGKSQAAKYIANEFGVPLYRLDLASSLGMYVGESEGRLARILNTLDQEEPAVLLLDGGGPQRAPVQ